MYILILFFILLYSVFAHADCLSTHLTGPFGFIREPYFKDPYSAEVCKWILDLGYYNVLEIRVESFNLVFGDFLYIRDGLSFNSQILVKMYGSSNYRKLVTSSGSAIIYFSRSKKLSKENDSQFNITYQIKGSCIPRIQAPCSESELSCYDLRYEKCDSIWNCPLSGRDEENCYSCPASSVQHLHAHFPCSAIPNLKCYRRYQRCDGIQDCETLADELHCDPLQCGEHNKTFLCSTFPSQCISDSLRCDGVKNCRDGSDERDCITITPHYESGRFRVIIVSSLSAILFLVMIALCLLCICRLHKIRILNSRRLNRHRGHSSYDDPTIQQLIDEEMRRQPPPPSYMNAIRFSRPFSSTCDLYKSVQPSRKCRTQHKLRSHRNRHSGRDNSNCVQPNVTDMDCSSGVPNEGDDYHKDSDTQLLVPDDNSVYASTNTRAASDSELIDLGDNDVGHVAAYPVN